jgi:hypothetical protein
MSGGIKLTLTFGQTTNKGVNQGIRLCDTSKASILENLELFKFYTNLSLRVAPPSRNIPSLLLYFIYRRFDIIIRISEILQNQIDFKKNTLFLFYMVYGQRTFYFYTFYNLLSH